MTVTMSIALLILRLGVGLTLAGHGVQKLFGWFGGAGLTRLRQSLEKQGFQPVWFWVALAIVGEVGGGLSVALGFLTPPGRRRHPRSHGDGDIQVALEKRVLAEQRWL